jgi:hypothetical protein
MSLILTTAQPLCQNMFFIISHLKKIVVKLDPSFIPFLIMVAIFNIIKYQ